jgi:hypothetical protein
MKDILDLNDAQRGCNQNSQNDCNDKRTKKYFLEIIKNINK